MILTLILLPRFGSLLITTPRKASMKVSDTTFFLTNVMISDWSLHMVSPPRPYGFGS